MSYYGNYAILLEKQRQEDNEKKKKQLIDKIRAQQEGFRRRYKDVYRQPKTYKGRALTREEFNEYMTFMKEYYAKKALREEKKRGNEFKLTKSADTFQKEMSQKKFGNKQTRGRPTTYTLKTNPEFLSNRKKRGPSGKILTNKRDYGVTLKMKDDNYFRGGKTRKRKRKRRRKTKRKRRRKRKTKKRR